MQATASSTQATDLAQRLGMFVGYLLQTHGRDVTQLAADFDLSFSQMKAMHWLRNAEEPVSVKALAESMGLSLAAMSRAADGLVQRGLVDRAEDAEDRRIKRLRLTESGADLVQRLRDGRMAGLDEFVSSLSRKEQALLAKALEPVLARDEVVAFCGGKR